MLLAAMLAACSGATAFAPDRAVDDLYSFLAYGAPEGEAQLDVQGTPFPKASPDSLAMAAARGFTGSVWHGPHVTFSTQARGARPGYRFILAFGASIQTSADALCDGSANFGGTVSSQAKLVFCADKRAYSEVTGSTGALAGPDDPAFRVWASAMMRALTPPPDPSVELR